MGNISGLRAPVTILDMAAYLHDVSDNDQITKSQVGACSVPEH